MQRGETIRSGLEILEFINFSRILGPETIKMVTHPTEAQSLPISCLMIIILVLFRSRRCYNRLTVNRTS